MKLKYQMRGLGIGIMVTALLMGVATGKGIPLSDAEIRAKALELGMVESDSLKLTDLANVSPVPVVSTLPEELGGADSDVSGESGDVSGAEVPGEADAASGAGEREESGANSDGDAAESGGADEAEGQAAESGGAAGSEEQEPESAAGGADAGNQGESENSSSGSVVRIVIEFGVTSAYVSEMLEEAGLVEDAAAFDSYLCNNGLSRKITAGTYEIVPGTSEEEIIQIITKN